MGAAPLPRWPHVVAAFVHGVMTLVCCVAAGNRHWFLFEARIPLWRLADGGGDPENRMVRIPAAADAGSWDVLGAAAVVHAFTTAAHAVYAVNPATAPRVRWWEYAVSAPLVFLQLAVTTGTRQVEVLLVIAGAVFAAMPYGFKCLQAVDAPSVVDRTRVVSGFARTGWFTADGVWSRLARAVAVPSEVTPGAALVTATVAVACVLTAVVVGYSAIATKAPAFVDGIVSVQLVLLSLFGVVGAVPVVAPWTPTPAAIEVAFCTLSFASKAVPTLIFVAGVVKS